jgi:uncharacterized membrane protein (UPF0127 family)
MRAMRAAVWGGTLALLLACNGAPAAPAPAVAKGSEPAPAAAAPAPAPSGERPRPRGEPQLDLPRGTVEIEAPPRAPVTLSVQVAATEAQRQKGLMFREQMPANEGMIFIFEAERHNSFWMHNTLIPLDLFFIKSDFTVLGVVENAEPLTDDPRGVPGLSQYVLETNAGFAREHGLGAGAKVRYTPPAGTGGN